MDFAVHFYIAKDKEGNMGFFKDVRDDIKAVLDRDPAARNGFEVLVCYPGIWSIIFHRPAHWLYRHNVKLLGTRAQSDRRSGDGGRAGGLVCRGGAFSPGANPIYLATYGYYPAK